MGWWCTHRGTAPAHALALAFALLSLADGVDSGVSVAESPVNPRVSLNRGPTRLSQRPRLPSLKAGFSTQGGGGFSSGQGSAKRYSPVRPDVVSMVNGPRRQNVQMGGWGTWWMLAGDKPVVSIRGRDGSGSYSDPGVIDGVGVNGTMRLAVQGADGGAKWLDEFELCEALLAPGTATWHCQDSDLGSVNMTTYPLQVNQTGLILRAHVASRAGSAAGMALTWAVTMTGGDDSAAVSGSTVRLSAGRQPIHAKRLQMP